MAVVLTVADIAGIYFLSRQPAVIETLSVVVQQKRLNGALHLGIGDIKIPARLSLVELGPVVLTRVDLGIDLEGAGGTSPEPNVVSGDAFAVLWTGEIEIPLTGTYTFIPRTADGVVLWINDVEVARG